MFRKVVVTMMLVLVGLSTAAVVSADMQSQRKGMVGMRGCGCCMGGMMGMGGMAGRRGMKDMAGTGKEEMAQQPLTEGRKKVGEAFTCPVDGKQKTVTEHTPATEYLGKTYYFCTQQDKEAFLKDPERYAKKEVSRVRGEKQ